MEALIFIAFIIIIILLFKIKAAQKETANQTHQSFASLQKELRELKETAKNSPAPYEQPVKPTDENVVQWRPHIPAEIIPEHTVPAQLELIPGILEEDVVSPTTLFIQEDQIAMSSEISRPNLISTATESWMDKWLRNNPDLEKFIGENLINKIGITVLVLGIAFFVKYAIDQNWIKEAGRVSIGIVCGVILTGVAHYLRNTYRSFSSVLAGGGIAVFYFTIAFGFHQYQLFSQTAAFVIMVIITIFAVLLSLLYDKTELAVIAAVGGFITPFLISTGNGNYLVLFTYLLILNLGMLALSYFKKWQIIHVIALFFTLIIYGGWLVQNVLFHSGFILYKNSLLFASAFYILFLGMGMVYNVRIRQKFKAFDFSLLLVTTFSYYAAGITNLHFWNEGAYQGLFTITLGVINFCLAGYFYKSNKGDKNLLFLLIGFTLTFISLAVPVQLHGHTITLFWSAEFVLLYWLHQRSTIRIFKYSSFVILILALISLGMDWYKANDTSSNHLTIIYKSTQGFITNVIAVVAFCVYAIRLQKEKNGGIYIAGIKNNTASAVMIIIAALIFYLTCIFGVNLYFYNNQNQDVPNGWHQLITYLFTALILWLISKYRPGVRILLRLLIISACVFMYLVSTNNVIRLRDGVIQNQYAPVQIMVHWISALLLLWLLYQAIVIYRNNKLAFNNSGKLIIWVINIVLIIFFSIECMHVYIYLVAPLQPISKSMQQYNKAGLTIVWALCSFTIMWLGMRHKYKTLRIVSLTLFSLALLKLFLLDIRNISEGGKITAFIMLGILLLIISFMYQKLKKLIIDDTAI